MNRFFRTSATALIVALGLSDGHTNAEIQSLKTSADATPDSPLGTTVTQSTCEARFARSDDPLREFHRPRVSDTTYTKDRLSTRDWPDHALDILGVINHQMLDVGTLSITDCAGSKHAVRVRHRQFELGHLNRQGSERRGWRFNAEAENIDEPIIRTVRLELPPSREWLLNEEGTGLIAAETIFHPLSEETAHFFKRVRVTEVTYENDILHVTQRTTTDRKFDVLARWALN